MKKVRVVLIAASLVLLAWFGLPLLLAVNLNIGNLTGIGISLLLLSYGVLLPKWNAWIRSLKKSPRKKWIYRGLVGILASIILLALGETGFMIHAACRKPAENATVVVLGCRVYGENPSLSMVERLKAAYAYLEENPGAVCILSGGQGVGEDISEAECMYRWLTEKGIDESRLYKEEESVSTRENLLFSGQLIEEEGLNPRIAIATSEYHQYRAGRIAASLGMEYGAVSAHTAVWLFPTFYVRELYGILYQWIF